MPRPTCRERGEWGAKLRASCCLRVKGCRGARTLYRLVPPPSRRHAGRIEKYIMRKAFDTPDDPYLPAEVRDGLACAINAPAYMHCQNGRSIGSHAAFVELFPLCFQGHRWAARPVAPHPQPFPSRPRNPLRCCGGRRSSSATAWGTTGSTGSRCASERGCREGARGLEAHLNHAAEHDMLRLIIVHVMM